MENSQKDLTKIHSFDQKMDIPNINKMLLGALYFVWSVPVINFILNPNYSPTAWPVWGAMGATILISLTDRRIIPIAIPFVALLSPLAYSSRVFGLLPSDLFLAYCVFSFLLMAISKAGHLKVLDGDVYLILLLPAALASYVLSFEYKALFPSLLNWIALISVFLVTRKALRTSKSISDYYFSLVVAAVYASVLIIIGFVNGMPLANFADVSIAEQVYLEKENLNYFFRASYFYVNVMYVLGPAIIVSLVIILTSKKTGLKIFSSGFLTILSTALFFMFAKTAFVALAISFLCILGILSFSPRRTDQNHRSLIRSLFVIFPSVLLFFLVSQLVVNADNNKLNVDSLMARLAVAMSSADVLLRQPERLIFGFGPDSSIRINNEVTDAARSSDGGVEGAIDSAYMTFVFEYGLAFLILFLLFGGRAISRLFRLIRRSHQLQPILIMQFVILIFIYIAAISQVISTSKVAWVVSQIFALTGICLSRNMRHQLSAR